MEIQDYLKKSDLFCELSKNAIDELSKKATLKNVGIKEIIFSEGFEGKFFYLLLKGSIRIFKTSYDGKESTIKIIRPGEIFAEAVLFKKMEYPASAIAAEESQLIAIHRDSFWRMMDDENSRLVFIGSVFDKLRFLTDQIHFLSTSDVEERFFRFLSDTYGKKYKYNISISKKDIASAIGTIPETFSRLLLRLTRNGIIVCKKETIIIKDGFWENDLWN